MRSIYFPVWLFCRIVPSRGVACFSSKFDYGSIKRFNGNSVQVDILVGFWESKRAVESLHVTAWVLDVLELSILQDVISTLHSVATEVELEVNNFIDSATIKWFSECFVSSLQRVSAENIFGVVRNGDELNTVVVAVRRLWIEPVLAEVLLRVHLVTREFVLG